jgi:phospholipase C
MADNAMGQFKHLVVVMMENRSFNNLLGFLCARENNIPPTSIPANRDMESAHRQAIHSRQGTVQTAG